MGESGKTHLRSIDNGQTWEAKQLLFTDNDLVTNNTYKRMAVTGDTVHIAVNYYGGEGGGWYGVLGYLRSTNNGASFESIRNLFTAPAAHHVYDARITASNGKVTIGFNVWRNWEVNDGYYLQNSDNGGTDFTQRTVYTTATLRRYVDDLQRVGDNIYVLFRQDGWVYLTASANAGLNFSENQMSLPGSPKVAYPCRTNIMCPRSPGWVTRFRLSGMVKTSKACTPSLPANPPTAAPPSARP
jgi:PKD repeat protein